MGWSASEQNVECLGESGGDTPETVATTRARVVLEIIKLEKQGEEICGWPVHARDDEKEVLLTWELLHIRGEGKKGRHLMTISISINYGIIISVSALSALLI